MNAEADCSRHAGKLPAFVAQLSPLVCQGVRIMAEEALAATDDSECRVDELVNAVAGMIRTKTSTAIDAIVRNVAHDLVQKRFRLRVAASDKSSIREAAKAIARQKMALKK